MEETPDPVKKETEEVSPEEKKLEERAQTPVQQPNVDFVNDNGQIKIQKVE